jgi:hypothetical protein
VTSFPEHAEKKHRGITAQQIRYLGKGSLGGPPLLSPDKAAGTIAVHGRRQAGRNRM